MKIMLATLCFNEAEFLDKLYQQHKDWPGLVAWVFVEGVDPLYLRANPHMVNRGSSVDGTREWLAELPSREPRARVWRVHHDTLPRTAPDQGKVPLRNCYLRTADELRPDWVVQIDADEAYSHDDQRRVNAALERYQRHRCGALMFRQRHIWRPPSIAGEPLFGLEAVGGYWDVPHARAFRWKPGLRHTDNHNVPAGVTVRRLDGVTGAAQCVHLGFAASLQSRQAKHAYYVARGEGRTDRRQMYVDCRAAWEAWKPGDSLPAGAQVVKYKGPIPEVFR